MAKHLLIFGFGYTAHFLAKKMRDIPLQVTATTRQQDAVGYNPEFDCDVIPFSSANIELALKKTTHILISTPPLVDGGDPVLAAFGHLIEKHRHHIEWIGYLSSTSVYGDHQGRWVDELSKPNALRHQGQLRLSAEKEWTAFAQLHQLPLTIFRLAGIYGPQRNVLARLMAGKQDTIVKVGHFFSRIHVEDIALVILASMQHSTIGVSIYNLADDEPTSGDVVDRYAASLLQRPSLKEIPYEEAILSPMAKDFYAQNKRVSNAKLKKELHIQLNFPSYKEGLDYLLRHEGYLCS